MKLNYEEDCKIDETALDVEWLEQPSLMVKYCREEAKAKKEVDLAKEEMDLIRAELDKDIRTNPEEFGISKITESVVSNIILAHEKYFTAQHAFFDAKFEADITRGMVRTMEHRKTALENLVVLHGQKYFAGSRVPRNLTQEKENRQKRADAGVAGKMKRNRKEKE